MATDSFDERQTQFGFLDAVEVPKMEAHRKVRTYDCSAGRHLLKPNGICMLCREQVLFSPNEDNHDV